jgi:hypothetical protein
MLHDTPTVCHAEQQRESNTLQLCIELSLPVCSGLYFRFRQFLHTHVRFFPTLSLDMLRVFRPVMDSAHDIVEPIRPLSAATCRDSLIGPASFFCALRCAAREACGARSGLFSFISQHLPHQRAKRASGTYWAKFTTRLTALSIGLFLVHLAQCPSPSVKHMSQIQRKPARRSAFPISYSDSPRVLQISGRLSSPASTCRCANFLCCCPFDFAQGLRLRPQARTRGSPTPAGARGVVFFIPITSTYHFSARSASRGRVSFRPLGSVWVITQTCFCPRLRVPAKNAKFGLGTLRNFS